MLQCLNPTTPTASAPDSKGIRLPKIDVPTFNGNILSWKTFWEQYSIAIHDQSGISDAQKLVYLRHSVKDGSAKGIIDGLSHSGEQYPEAIECLRTRYNRPRLIHQAHVRKILEVPTLKEGNGKELRHLHDVAQQHLRALKSMGYEPSGTFITSVLELKLDQGTMFEWQKHSHETPDIPHYRELLDFINLRAQALEISVSDVSRKVHGNDARKSFSSGKPVAAFAANATPPATEYCVLCKTSRHPLYACGKFKSLSHERMVATIKSNGICINCLKPGHFVKDCRSLRRCRDCQKPHHSLLHLEMKSNAAAPAPSEDSTSPNPAPSGESDSSIPVQSHAATGLKSNSLLMTCQIVLTSPKGTSMKARALLVSTSSTSFISERLAKSPHLPRSQHSARISGIAGLSRGSPSHQVANFIVCPLNNPGKRFGVSAIIAPRVTCDLPVHPVPLDPGWTHLGGFN